MQPCRHFVSVFEAITCNASLGGSKLIGMRFLEIFRLTPVSSSCSSPYLMATVANTDNELCSSVNITQSFPFELHYIKALYLNHQYKECARRCEELLAHNQNVPAHAIFLNFYAALSYEGLARIMHVYSVWRLPKITAAESAYNKALDACSTEEHLLGERSMLYNIDLQDLSTRTTPVPEMAHVRRSKKPSIAHLGPGSAISRTNSLSAQSDRINFSWPRSFTPLSCATVKAIQYSVCQDMMAPLEDPFTMSVSESPNGPASDHSTPIRTENLNANKDVFDSPHPPSPTRSYRSTPPTSITDKAQAACTTHLMALHSQLNTHLTQLLELKHSTIADQAERVHRQSGTLSSSPSRPTKLPQSRSFWSFKDPETEKKEMLSRIEEGRARGWKSKRFEAKKYAQLAEKALAELEI
ncbi:hypothetical protein D6C86_03102 [Aureobasidium pullulans]|uniref:Uncharacterized protein n=1 Tax=Aureobasidium pullulans TaxID=5580 RepID=A0A4S9UUZ5_AURPU|nr:hypothetical protein D6C94_03310 [Aureobasidium pullulans]THZ41888.1 hypothetical protein D6C87_05414 [Aureobasidium pullulans]THZ63423.1 hypothetical protein D6C86_03102 [Aureobasidium pullulans]THZ94786.1 hypothetical protein D6C88_02185 [Aureobasidium pullulans]